MLGKIEGRRRRGWKRMRCLDGIADLMDMSLSKLQEIVKDRDTWCATVHGAAKSQTWLSDWVTTEFSPMQSLPRWQFPVKINCFLKYVPIQFSSLAQSCPTLCDPMNYSTPGLPIVPYKCLLFMKFPRSHGYLLDVLLCVFWMCRVWHQPKVITDVRTNLINTDLFSIYWNSRLHRMTWGKCKAESHLLGKTKSE